MKVDMAESEYFSIGSIVSCETCHNQKIQGEVLAFDLGTKMLAIKSTASNREHNQHDVRLLNLSFVSDVKVIEEAPEGPLPPLPSINLGKINSRLKHNLEAKRRLVSSIGVGVTQEGQKVFNAIFKTINEVRWEGKEIVVMDEVLIKPPYGLDDCYVYKNGNTRALEHVKKIVQKHLSEVESQRNNDLRKSMSPSPAPSSAS
ncbi:hypothetical protein ACJMK2_023856 [Sinanodonta woodiana]|uniref:AD domain-containing protein n=1 Tax=Sinanodonta woodiana TaxID=1069815 RepID=A0ABD3T5L5_SINWO